MEKNTSQMQAIEVSGTSCDSLKVAILPKPVLRSGEVLVKVTAAGINYADIVQRRGKYPVPQDASPLLGLEVSGQVVAVENVNSFEIGDFVCALTNGGGYAQYVAVPATQCLPIPSGVSLVEAASLPETYFTVWAYLFDDGFLKKGMNLLVHGGSGGIGTTAIQLATAMGVNVYTTCGSDEKCQVAESLGAKRAINYHKHSFAKILGEECVDIVLDHVGGDYLLKNLAVLRKGGRLIQIGYLQGKEATIDLSLIMAKRLWVTGGMMRPMSPDEKAKITLSLKEKVWPLFEKKILKPMVYKVFDFKEAPAAHRLMESKDFIGKIVLVFDM